MSGPGDLPGGRPEALDRLEALVGRWEMEASFAAGFFGPDSAPVTGRGRTTFEWLEGRYFLTQRFVSDAPQAPDGIAIIGAGDAEGELAQHYYDSRGVARVYQMSLADGVWEVWRAAPGFWQRYAGALSADGATIEGAWEASPDGRDWQRDFGLNYYKIG